MKMLQAQIDIVDEAGHVEESMLIVGSGRVSIGTRPTGGYLHTDEAETDLIVVTRDGMQTLIQVKTGPASAPVPLFVEDGTTLRKHVSFIEALRRHLEIQQIFVAGALLQGNAIIQRVAPSGALSSSLVRRAQASIARGTAEVTEQLQRLRGQGKIDEEGNVLVPWPDDMQPGSTTDL